MSNRAPCYVRRIEIATPIHSMSESAFVDALRTVYPDPREHRLVRRLAKLTGIERRYFAALDHQREAEPDSLYAPAAAQPRGPGMGARNSLFESSAAPLLRRLLAPISRDLLATIDTLITVSCTHASAPGLERPIFAVAPIPAAADRWNLGFMGCSAGLAALRLAARSAGQGQNALIVACELSSLHFQYSARLDQLTANLLFADGAAAVLTGSAPTRIRVAESRSITLPVAARQMTWLADDHGLRLELAPELPDTLAAHLPNAVAAFLDECNLRRADIDLWAVHPGGPQILDAVERSLELPANALFASRDVLRRFGNLSSPTIFFILKEMIESGADGLCVAIAFGPGLTIELALLDIASRAAR